MPVVSCSKERLLERVGKQLSDDSVDQLCFDYGLELDAVTTADDTAGSSSSSTIYRIEVPANRHDLLCVEGLSRALAVFCGTASIPRPSFHEPPNQQHLSIVQKQETVMVRPFLVAAVLRNINLSGSRYESFIELQEKLHQNVCRKRSLVAIGTHDLSTVEGPFSYEALPPEDISFVPLKQSQIFNARELMSFYKHDVSGQQLRGYLHLIEDSPVYPVILDANRNVLSLPPIINSQRTAITDSTRDILIECTAKDFAKAELVLNNLTSIFSEFCNDPFTVEPVDVVDALGTKRSFPDLQWRSLSLDKEYINRRLGLNLNAASIADALKRMMIDAHPVDESHVQTFVPPTRADVLHACDLAEDVAIAYGFNNVPMQTPTEHTRGGQQPLNVMGDLLRSECANMGFTEVLTWILLSKEDAFSKVNMPDDGTAALISNPSSEDVQVARVSLLPGMMKTLASNKKAALPVRLFELGEVVVTDKKGDVGARNERHLLACNSDLSDGFEVVHGLLDRMMKLLGASPSKGMYEIEPQEAKEEMQKPFFPGRQGRILLHGQAIGTLGVVHPDVLARFGLSCPASIVEINVEPLLSGDQHGLKSQDSL